MVSIIIPVFNENKTIGEIVKNVINHPKVKEVIVVDDGSTDGTQASAQKAGARVLRLQRNGGKAGAMDAGVESAASDIILFLDGDVVGWNHEKISIIIDPVIDGRLGMHVGILPRLSVLLLSKKIFYFLPVLSGMRALTKTLWRRVPRVQKDGFKMELALNHAARKWGRATGYEIIPGLVHATKEKKYGLLRGLWRRGKMIGEIISISFQLYVRDSAKDLLRKALKIEFNKAG